MRRGTRLVTAIAVAGLVGCGGSSDKPEGGVDATTCGWEVPTQAMTGTPCRYAVPDPPACNPDFDRARIGVKIAGNELVRDPNHVNGWDYTDGSMEGVEIYGPSCDALTASPALPVTIVFKLLLP